MKHLDLFSGIGGFALAAARVWQGHEVVAFCEIDKFCQKVLEKHWPHVPIYDDIKKLKGDQFGTVDIISGGFPCQPFSAAGKRAGTKDDRHLWPEMLRVISEVRPRWVIAENVAGLVSLDKGMVLDTVLTDLEGEGYQVQPFIIPACAINAPHRRDRVWIVGNATQQLSHRTRNTGPGRREEYSDGGGDATDTGLLRPPKHEKQTAGIEQCGEDAADTQGGKPRQQTEQERREDSGRGNIKDVADTSNQGLQGRRKLGEPKKGRQPPEGIGQDPAGCSGVLANTYIRHKPQCRNSSGVGRVQEQNPWDGTSWIEAASRLCLLDARLSPGLDGRGVIRNKYRTQKLKALGNAIVPQVAEQIFKAIKKSDMRGKQ